MSDSERRSPVRRLFANPSEGRLRAGWRLLLGLFAFVVAALVAGVLTAVVASAALALGIAGSAFPRVIALYVLLYPVFVGLLVLLARYVGLRFVPDLGLGGPGWWRNLALGLGLGVAMTTAVFAVELAAGLLTVTDLFVTRPGLGVTEALPFPVAIALTLAMFVAVGVGEEVFFRGFVMTNLAEGLSGVGPIGTRAAIGVAAVVSSVLFGLVHVGNANATALATVNIFAAGLFFAGAYVATDDLGVPIGVHVTWNFSLSSLYGFPVSGITTPATVLDVAQTGPEVLTGGEFGPEGGLVFYLALAVAVAVTWWWVRREHGAVRFRESVAVPDLRRSRTAGPERSDAPDEDS